MKHERGSSRLWWSWFKFIREPHIPELEDKRNAVRRWNRRATTLPLVSKGGDLLQGREVHLHLGFDLDWFAVKQVALVFPLFHGLDRGRSEYRVSAD